MVTPSTPVRARHRVLRGAMYRAAEACLVRTCKHVDEVACTEAWFEAMRKASPTRLRK